MKLDTTSAAILFAACSTVALAAPENYTMDPNHTYPSFEVGHAGVSVFRGKFTRTTGKATLDRVARTGSVDIAIEASSVDIGNPRPNDHLKSKDFFHAEQFPVITYKADTVRFNGETPSMIEGSLTLLGVTRPLPLALNWVKCFQHPMFKREVCGADAIGTFKRSDFGMKYGLPMNGDEVTLRIQVEAVHD